MVLKLRSVVRLIVVICVIFWLVNLFRWRASTIDDTEPTALPIHACSHKEKLIEAHTSTVQVWNDLFQHQVANGNLSFGLQTSTIGDCGVVMSNFSAPIIQGHLTESPFDRWSYSYQISNGLILMRTGDQRCSSLNINNVFTCIDYVRGVKNVLGRLTTKGVMVWLIPDVISSGQSNINDEYDDFEIKYLYHSLVIKYIIADGVVVVPAGTEDSLSSSLCSVLSALIPDNLKKPVSLQSAVQSVHDFIVSAHRLCKSDAPPSLHNVCYRHMHTRKYEPRCLPSLKQYEEIVEAMTGDKTTLRTSQPRSVGIFPLLITGLGGSGTHNVANILNGVGINVAHEGIAPYGSVSWLYGANDWTMGSSYPYGPLHPTLIVPYAGLLVPRYQHVLHLVRQPLRQIASVTSHSNFTYAFIMQFMELKAKDSVVQKFRKAHEMQSTCVRGGSCHLYFSALAWVHWNRHVRSYSDGTYLLEDLPKLFKTVCSLAYSSSPVKAAKCVEEANELNDSGTYSSQDISWWSNLWSSVRFHNADVHKIHLSYTMKDISDIDPELAVDIAHDMVIYGLNNLPQ